jgi:hypothetical protein
MTPRALSTFFSAAVAMRYPIAFNNLALAYEGGLGVLQMLFFNRTVQCCAVCVTCSRWRPYTTRKRSVAWSASCSPGPQLLATHLHVICCPSSSRLALWPRLIPPELPPGMLTYFTTPHPG